MEVPDRKNRETDGKWRDNISSKIRRMETFFYLLAIPFAAILSTHIWTEYVGPNSIVNARSNSKDTADSAALRELQEAMLSLREIKDAISDLRGTQDAMITKIEEDKTRTERYKSSSSQRSREAPSRKKLPEYKSETDGKPEEKQVYYSKAAEKFMESMEATTTISDNHRKLEQVEDVTDEVDIGCDGTLFRAEIQLDNYPSETTWELTGADLTGIVNMTYANFIDNFTTAIYEECITPGAYEFTMYDQYGDGISCESEDGICYDIFIDNELAFQGSFETLFVSHSFDSSSVCLYSKIFQIDHAFTELSDMEFDLVNDRTKQSYDLLPVMDSIMNSLYACLSPGVYSLTITNANVNSNACDGNIDGCYAGIIGSNIIIRGDDLLRTANHFFFIAVDGTGREKTCHQLPILSPINKISTFEFDERVGRALNVIHALSSMESIYEKNSIQYRATCFMLYDDARSIRAEDRELVQRYALAVLLFGINEDAEVQLGMDTCANEHFYCNRDGFITMINWSGVENDVGGVIPSEIAHLLNLERLDLGGNGLTGPIPNEIERLTGLRKLFLPKNHLTGTIPTVFGNIPTLSHINFWDNELTGSIPSEFGRLDLKWLIVHENKLSGTFPPELMDCTNFEIVAINANPLITGTISSKIGNLQSIILFSSENNHLTGTLPSELGNLSYIITFDVGFNALTGSIPTELSNVLFNELRLNDNFLTGELPPLFIEEKIYISNNDLTGEIPEFFWEQSNITGLKFNDNNLIGSLPDDYCDNLTEVPGYINVFDLFMDDSPWFVDTPKVICECCDDVNCHMWDNKEIMIVGGTRRPACPISNLFSTDIYELYAIVDLSANVTHGSGIGTGIAGVLEFCLSPTGCYFMSHDMENGLDDGAATWDVEYNIGYSSSTRSLVEQESCDSVDVCSTFIEFDSPKRKGLNHITHMVLSDLTVLDNPSLPEYMALCWLFSVDELYFDYDVCDGTLLQRYVLALFYHTHQETFGFDVLSSTPTCDWPGITCDTKFNKFVEKIVLPNKDLKGSLITEIGLLTRLQTINLSGNGYVGIIDPVIFAYLPNLEYFNIGNNRFGGTIPKEVLLLPSLKGFNMSSNLLVGEIDNDIEYTQTLEKFNVGNNLLYGFIPDSLIRCPNLKVIDLSRNSLKGGIPPEIGQLENLEILRLHVNILSGSIPLELFDMTKLEIIELQANDLTGGIPSELGDMENATFISLSHNNLKGPIPTTLNKLQKLEYLHLQMNTVTGQAPSLPYLRILGGNKYITDCGSPSFHLLNPISCETCTMCCNSDEMCQENRIPSIPIEGKAFTVTFAVPAGIAVFAFLLYLLSKKVKYLTDTTDPLLIYDEDSTYSLLFSDSYVAYLMYAITILGQGAFYYTFLLASSFTHSSSDWQFSTICPPTSIVCNDTNTVNNMGWFLFFVVTLATLGVDYVNAAFQMRKSVALRDLWLFFSGFAHFALTTLALYTSYFYNLATAPANTDLILNAVILLFINDFDEQIMNALQAMFPEWVDERIEEIRVNMEKRVSSKNDDNDDDDGFGKTEMFE